MRRSLAQWRILSDMPIWFQNLQWMMSYFDDEDIDARIVCLKYFAPMALRWLDEVRIVGDPVARRTLGAMLRLMNQLADFRELQEPLGYLTDVVTLHKRSCNLIKSLRCR